jgi:hypothetical protein
MGSLATAEEVMGCSAKARDTHAGRRNRDPLPLKAREPVARGKKIPGPPGFAREGLPMPSRRTFAVALQATALCVSAALRHPCLRLLPQPARGHGKPLPFALWHCCRMPLRHGRLGAAQCPGSRRMPPSEATMAKRRRHPSERKPGWLEQTSGDGAWAAPSRCNTLPDRLYARPAVRGSAARHWVPSRMTRW